MSTINGGLPKLEPVALPRPLAPPVWPKALRDDVEALWVFHHALSTPILSDRGRRDRSAYFASEAEKAGNAVPLYVVEGLVWGGAYEVCEKHDLPLKWLADQVRGAHKLSYSITRFKTPADVDAFISLWAKPHALLLARLAGAGHSWQEEAVGELARAFFITARLTLLSEDLRERDRLFIARSDLEDAGVTVEQLRAGEINPNVRKLFWKQSVRVRSALAHAQPLIKEVPRRYRGPLKRAWLGTLEVLHELERRDYDVWSGPPVRLSVFRRTQVWLQALLGNAVG